MGDILHALPAVTALRMAHPGWVIDWVVEPKWQALLAAPQSAGRDTGSPSALQPIVDRLHLASTKEWRHRPLSGQTLLEIRALRRALRAGEYDTVLDLQGAVRSAVVSRMAGSRRLIGEAIPRERAARWLFHELVPTRGAHVIEQDVELASAVAGDELEAAQPWLPVDPAAESWADAIFDAKAGQHAVLINPGAGWGAKRWPVERYASVAEGLMSRGFRILVNAGPGEETLAEVLVKQTGGAATPLACSLGQLIALTRRISAGRGGGYGPAAPGLRPGQAGGGHLRPHRPEPQRAIWEPFQGVAQRREPPGPHPPRSAGGGIAHHTAGRRAAGSR